MTNFFVTKIICDAKITLNYKAGFVSSSLPNIMSRLKLRFKCSVVKTASSLNGDVMRNPANSNSLHAG